MTITVFPKKYKGNILIPSSKSDTQRALLAASLSYGKSILKNVGISEDDKAMLSTIKQLGASVKSINENDLEIDGIESFPSEITLHCGESGLGSRLLISICASQTGKYTLNAEGSLLKRTMSFYVDFLKKHNLQAKFFNDHYLPVSLIGGLNADEFVVDGTQSSQYISGLLMALPLLKGNSSLKAENLKSIPYVDMTIQTLKQFGIQIQRTSKESFFINGNQSYQSTEYTVESDWSSASFWLVASALGQEITVSGLNIDSLQADRKIIEILISAGCELKIENGQISFEGKNRKGFEADLTDCPDLFPISTIFAVLSPGTSVLHGVERLINKESNRGKVLQEGLAKLGVAIQLNKNTMIIEGVRSVSGGVISSHNDHRIAMAFAILGMFSESALSIENAEAVSKSYPNFWEEIANL
jgi:3-phosphoshikimate 1-carboxyvinyltransferase